MKLLFLFFSFGLLVLVFSCKKLNKYNPIEFKIKAHIPYNDEPISGVKYTIREYKAKKNGSIGEIEYTDFELEGTTNSNGIAEIAFLPKKNKDYMYRIDFDYSNIDFASYSGSYSLINAPGYDLLTRNNQRDYEIRALPLMEINYRLENVNCLGEADSMRIIIRNYDVEHHLNLNNEMWSPYNMGCYSETSSIQAKSGRYMYKIQIRRNGILTEYMDTILVAPGINNNLFIEY